VVAASLRQILHRRSYGARAWLVPKVHRWRDRFDDGEVRAARRLARSLQATPPDVVCFGDSTWLFTAPGEPDQRDLRRALSDELAGPSVMALAGGGYHPGLARAFLHVIELHEARPVLVIPLCVRMHTVAWRTHPAYTYERATAAIHAISSPRQARRVRRSAPGLDPAEMQAFEARRIETWMGATTVGELRNPLRHPHRYGLSAEEQERMRYALHHGEAVDPTGPAVEALRKLGRALHLLGAPFVLFETPIPVERGVELFGEPLRERAAANLAILRAAVTEGYGSPLQIASTGLIFEQHEFIDPADASEHLNHLGRNRLAAVLAARVREELARRPVGVSP
jgi:hypothetical protein